MKNLEFTPCERELNTTLTMLSNNATELLKKLEHGTPAFYQARLIAWQIDEMLDRLQLA